MDDETVMRDQFDIARVFNLNLIELLLNSSKLSEDFDECVALDDMKMISDVSMRARIFAPARIMASAACSDEYNDKLDQADLSDSMGLADVFARTIVNMDNSQEVISAAAGGISEADIAMISDEYSYLKDTLIQANCF